jgi:hypothetical protein
LCNNLRITNQLKNDKKHAKQELRSFYEQYSFPPLIVPYKKSYKSTKNSNKFMHNRKQPVYGQTSHYIDESQLSNILSESNTESEELLQIKNNIITSQKEYSDSNKENEIGFCFCKDKNMCTCRKEINTLTREERIILELIDQIEDPEIKIKYLSQISQNEKIITNGINYNFTNVSNRFKKEKRPTTVQDLKFGINNIKQELKNNFKISNE